MSARYYCHTFSACSESPASMVERLTSRAREAAGEDVLLRLVFFTGTRDEAVWDGLALVIKGTVSLHFPGNPPVWSLVAQMPLEEGGAKPDETLSLEAHYYHVAPGQQVVYKDYHKVPYILIEGNGEREMFFSVGKHNIWLPEYVPSQAFFVFGKVHDMMQHEGFGANTIVRQWNYVEGITEATLGCQHYQAMNDARSEFYADSDWSGGFPAATGIGSDCGGMLVDINAATGIASRAIDNPLQVAAHNYPGDVLLAGKVDVPTTPKFERARYTDYPGSGVCYISGTAAIRQEHSLADMDAEHQTVVTLENIDALTSQVEGGCRVDCARIYLKYPESYPDVKKIVEKHYPNADLIFTKAEVCRQELLVEIEALASVRNT